jgi:hypothetical protein
MNCFDKVVAHPISASRKGDKKPTRSAPEKYFLTQVSKTSAIRGGKIFVPVLPNISFTSRHPSTLRQILDGTRNPQHALRA